MLVVELNCDRRTDCQRRAPHQSQPDLVASWTVSEEHPCLPRSRGHAGQDLPGCWLISAAVGPRCHSPAADPG